MGHFLRIAELGLAVTWYSYGIMAVPKRSSSVNCWICNAPANSGEHRVKSAALQVIFSKPINQGSPLYYWTDLDWKRIGSVKADRLKFPQLICDLCNTTTTQPHDMAWQRLIEFVHRDCTSLSPGDRIDLWKIFPDSPVKGMIGVQLYFAKLMGCIMAESKKSFELTSFSSAILHNTPHPHLYLTFGTMPNAPKQAGQSDVYREGSSVSFIHTVGMLSVIVLHAPDGEDRLGKKNAWHPTALSDSLEISCI